MEWLAKPGENGRAGYLGLKRKESSSSGVQATRRQSSAVVRREKVVKGASRGLGRRLVEETSSCMGRKEQEMRGAMTQGWPKRIT